MNFIVNKIYKFAFLISIFINFEIKAIEPDEILDDQILENRAKYISKELRCLVCQNEDINNSNADIARDLRLLIRDELLDGKTDREIINFIHSRYGDFILYKPPIKLYTIFLWIFPFVLFLSFLFLFFKKKK
tara:strand:- start:1336 stop:1731 length:396 start_codon:yes stop_codon:yes gene_type:complete